MSRLSQRNTVLYVDSMGLRRPTMAPRDLSRIGHRLIKGLRGVRKISPRLYVLSPLVIPLHQQALVRMMNTQYLRMILRSARSTLRLRNPILWTYTPLMAPLIREIRPAVTVYHCVDELSKIPNVPTEVVTRMERELLLQSDIVFSSSRQLFETRRAINANTHYIPNVADIDHFGKAHRNSPALPEDMRGIRHPIVGFIGAMAGHTFDVDLIRRVAQARPQWSVVLIGPIGFGDVTRSIGTLRALPNVHLLETKPYSLLPSYLKAFDACMIPYLVNDYTVHVFPLKFYEYLATGKPVVTTALPELQSFAHLVEFARSHDEFLHGLDRAINEDTPRKCEDRLQWAQGHTWEANIDKMSDLIEPMYRRKMEEQRRGPGSVYRSRV